MAAVQGIALNQLPPPHNAQTNASSSETSSPSVASSGISPEPEAEPTSPATSSHWYSHELNLANALAFVGVALALVYGGLQVRYMMWTAANDTLQSCLSAISLGSRSDYCDRIVSQGVQAPPLGPRSILLSRESAVLQYLATSPNDGSILKISGASVITLGTIIASFIWFRRKMRYPEHGFVSIARTLTELEPRRPIWRIVYGRVPRNGPFRSVNVALSNLKSWPLPPSLIHILDSRKKDNDALRADNDNTNSDSSPVSPEHVLVFDKSGEGFADKHHSPISVEFEDDLGTRLSSNLSRTTLDSPVTEPANAAADSCMEENSGKGGVLWQSEFKHRVAKETLAHQQQLQRECSPDNADLDSADPGSISTTRRSSRMFAHSEVARISQRSAPIDIRNGKNQRSATASGSGWRNAYEEPAGAYFQKMVEKTAEQNNALLMLNVKQLLIPASRAPQTRFTRL